MLNGAVPPFDLQGGLLQAAIRALWLAALFSGLGTLAMGLAVAPAAMARMPAALGERVAGRLHRLAASSLLAALPIGVAWLALQSADMSDADNLADVASALPTVALRTSFGHLLLLQLAGVAAALLLSLVRGPRRRAAAFFCGTAVLLQAGHGHAAAMGSRVSLLLLADVVHLMAAALWLGGLVPLLLLVRDCPPRAGMAAARTFATMGRLCVLGLIGSAAVQGWVLIGDIPGLFGTAYGWIVLVKLALLGILLAFAARNRYRLAPALGRPEPPGGGPRSARHRLVRSIAQQTGFGIAAVLAAAVLTGLPPSMHVQPVWPFSVQPSLAAIREDPEFRTEVIEAALALAGAVVLLGIAWRLRRGRGLPLVGLALTIVWLAVPHFDLLLAEAGPMTYFRSPTEFAAASILRGVALYPDRCASCHGAQGHGDGTAASGLAVPPADLTASHLWMHSDGELFGWLSSGMSNPDGPGLVMPGFAVVLTEDDRWALIDAIRARNAGLARAASGAWSPPLAAPAFDATCADGQRVNLRDLRGRMVRLAIGVQPPVDPVGVVTVVAGQALPTRPGRCATDDEAVSPAYALVAGIAVDRIAGTQFLIDGDGWLRAVQSAAAGPGWDDPARLAEALAQLRAAPISAPAAMHSMPM